MQVKIKMIHELFTKQKIEFKIVLFSSPKTLNTYVVKLLVHEILWIGIQLILYVLSRMQFKEF